MTLIPNTAKQRLGRGEITAGFSLRQSRTADTGLIAKACGFHWLMIDLEHNAMDLDTAAQIGVAAMCAGITPIVRVPGPEHWQATRLLDTGAQGIIFPHVDDAETAERVVSQCLFPPRGRRSLTGGLPQVSFGSSNYPAAELVTHLNDNILVVVMLETARAIAHADAIAAVPGVDVLLIGTNDLCADLGLTGQIGHETVADAYRATVAAAKAHGKAAGMAGVYDQLLMTRYIAMGCRFVQAAVDLALIMQAGRERMEFLNGLLLRPS